MHENAENRRRSRRVRESSRQRTAENLWRMQRTAGEEESSRERSLNHNLHNDGWKDPSQTLCSQQWVKTAGSEEGREGESKGSDGE